MNRPVKYGRDRIVKPNIVMVMTDQHRADLRAACGYPLDTMPFLDQWAAGGMDFRRAYTPNPCCVPARVSLFTSRYPSCHHVRTNHNAADVLYAEDLLDVMHRAGYQTALCGKNHTHRKPEEFDFHEHNSHLGGPAEGDRTPQEAEFSVWLRETKHWEMHQPAPGGVEAQYPYRNVSSAFRFLDEYHKQDKPFFMWLSFAEPHNPYQVPEPYFDLFPPEALPPIEAGAEAGALKGEDYRWERAGWERAFGDETEKRILRTRSNYHGMLRLIDDQFRRFIGGLEERGLSDNTIVVFLADHGEFAGEYGLIRKGVGLPEVLTRIPMVWRGPGVQQGVRDDEHCVSLVDVLPTLCQLCGEPLPLGSQGRSLLPVLQGEKCDPREFALAYSESGYGGLYWNDRDGHTMQDDSAMKGEHDFICISSWTWSGHRRMIRKGDWKLEMDMLGNAWLYNLKEDPQELDNRWEDPSLLGIRADMAAEMSAMLIRAVDPLPSPHHRYRVKKHPQGYWFDEDFTTDRKSVV